MPHVGAKEASPLVHWTPTPFLVSSTSVEFTWQASGRVTQVAEESAFRRGFRAALNAP